MYFGIERWHDTEWEGYQVSTLARVRSLPRDVPMVVLCGSRRNRREERTRRIKGKLLRLHPTGECPGHFVAKVGGKNRTLKQILRSAGLPENLLPCKVETSQTHSG